MMKPSHDMSQQLNQLDAKMREELTQLLHQLNHLAKRERRLVVSIYKTFLYSVK